MRSVPTAAFGYPLIPLLYLICASVHSGGVVRVSHATTIPGVVNRFDWCAGVTSFSCARWNAIETGQESQPESMNHAKPDRWYLRPPMTDRSFRRRRTPSCENSCLTTLHNVLLYDK